jgi:GAF domain-containing protein
MTDAREVPDSGDRFIESRFGRPANLCTPFIEQLPISGVSISVFDEAGRQSTICTSDATAARLDEIQFDLGEGPHWEALRTGQPVLVSNVLRGPHDAWPIFAEALRDLDVGALFAFPMVMGAVTVGVVDLYRSVPEALDGEAFGLAISLSARVARRAVHEALQLADDDSAEHAIAAPAMRREVHQATGIVLVQLGVSASEAFFRLRAHAFANGRSVQDVARDVVAQRIDFSVIPE